jgi:hypothetical protein
VRNGYAPGELFSRKRFQPPAVPHTKEPSRSTRPRRFIGAGGQLVSWCLFVPDPDLASMTVLARSRRGSSGVPGSGDHGQDRQMSDQDSTTDKCQQGFPQRTTI